MKTEQETIVISVGGSLIVPDQIDTDFLSRLKKFIDNETALKDERRFVVICGGGKIARRYQEAASAVSTLEAEDVDWIGIHATTLNAHLVRTIFRDIAYPEVIKNPDDIRKVPEDTKLIAAAGYRPGSSTDLRAVQIAVRRGAKKMINLSNIDYVYTADPRIDHDAKEIHETTWAEFRKVIPEKWDPGLSSPFDPVAAREAEEHNIEVAVINGHRLPELQKYLNDEEFVGTKIVPN